MQLEAIHSVFLKELLRAVRLQSTTDVLPEWAGVADVGTRGVAARSRHICEGLDSELGKLMGLFL